LCLSQERSCINFVSVPHANFKSRLDNVMRKRHHLLKVISAAIHHYSIQLQRVQALPQLQNQNKPKLQPQKATRNKTPHRDIHLQPKPAARRNTQPQRRVPQNPSNAPLQLQARKLLSPRNARSSYCHIPRSYAFYYPCRPLYHHKFVCSYVMRPGLVL